MYELTRMSSFLNSRYIERNIGKKPPETYYYDVDCPWLVDGASKCPTLTMEVTLGKTVVVSSSRVESEIHIKTDEAKKEFY